jgi:soluble lytic murein transglycosylase-like protein
MTSRLRRAGGSALVAVVAAGLLLRPAAAPADPVDRWASEIADASLRFGLPEQWIRRIIRAESGGRMLIDGRPIVSRAGAMGLMQLMPGTWRDMRALLRLGSDPNDPRDNIAAGTAYLRLMYDRFGYPGMFAAYHAGPARYAAYISGRRTLPPETRAYAARVTAGGGALADPAPPEARRPAFAAIFVLRRGGTPVLGTQPDARAPSNALFVALGQPAER